MIEVYVLLAMIFCHIVEDYALQGLLAKFKQKEFWENTGEKYYNDYIVALWEHAFENAFLVTLPIVFYYRFDFKPHIFFLGGFLLIFLTHGIIDGLKANAKKINLIQDQVLHLIIIFFAWFLMVVLG